jgi:type IV secretory pathway VirJ component
MKLKIFVVLSLIASLSYSQEVMEFGQFGKVTLYRSSPEPKHVVLFISGDGGWNLGVIDMAKAVASLDALVVGIDINHYLKQLENSNEKCSYPAADFEELSKFIQEKKKFPDYITPLLVGYSSGATLVYAALVQAPPDTFSAAISMGFCPDLPLEKPLCKGYGLQWGPGPKGKGYRFLPAHSLVNPWIAFQGLSDIVCNAKDVEAFVNQVKNGVIVKLEKVGHGFSVQKNWLPQFKETFINLFKKTEVKTPQDTNAPPSRIEQSNIDGLPLVEILPQQWETDYLVVILSGDGGWASIDRSIGEALVQEGIGVVGFNSLKYFWHRRTPQEAANDLKRILNYYAVSWKKNKVMVIGYSLGADVLPFMINRLDEPGKNLISAIVLLGPSKSVDFEFHLTDWLGGTSGSALPVLPEVEKLKGKNILCVCGHEEDDSLCLDIPPGLAHTIKVGGGHHFGGDYKKIVDIILKNFN